jgi:spoIIIJ-associated protein
MAEHDRPDGDDDEQPEAKGAAEPDEETAEFRGDRPGHEAEPGARQVPPAELVGKARGLCEELVRFFPLGQMPVIRARHDEETVFLQIEGDGSGLLIGKKGQTLDALQYLLQRMVNHNVSNRMRVELDTENYRSRRRSQISALARKVADEVRASGRAQALEPMSPTERRLVHLALRDMPDVVTESEGAPPERYVVIRPRSGQAQDDSAED